MDVSRHARTGGFSNIHPQINPLRLVHLPQYPFHALRQIDHFVRRFYRQLLQFVQMSERHNHHVSGGVREGIEDDVAVLATVNNAGLGVIPRPWQVAEDTAGGQVNAGHVGITPGSPEIVHKQGRVAEDQASGS